MLNQVLLRAPYFLLVYARCFAMIVTLPLFSMRAVNRRAKLALSFYMAFLMLPAVDYSSYEILIMEDQAFSVQYLLLVLGEGLIGIIMGFYLQIIFAAFSTAGQFFAFQMGFSAASAYDALSQVENPLMGQYLNLIGMLIFMQNRWFQKVFMAGLMGSFKAMNAFSIVNGTEPIARFMLKGLSNLFADALVIALPVMGTLLLISVATGLLSKAAPQMNLLSEGFPVMILLAFFLILNMLPAMSDFFIRSFNKGLADIANLFMTWKP
ncbi:MAG: flagellar biosynthetic protein FliR [Treponema sp.]|nr:flagellar biosynthetic protein FliR [Treponema sp.]